MKRGFTLIEALIVLTLIGILVSILVPQYRSSVIRAKEAVLKENLFQMRDAINKFYTDKKKYPTSLEELAANRYLRDVPVDPFTKNKEWELIHAEPGEEEDYDPEIHEGIVDVKSRAKGVALDGSTYTQW